MSADSIKAESLTRAHTETDRRARRRRRAAKLLLLVFSILVGLLIAEVCLRIIGYTFPLFYVVDHDRGYALGPRLEGWYRKETEVYVRINSAGLHDYEHAVAKPPNTLRIAVIGDSYAEALHVSLEEAFWSVMKRKLEECPAIAGRRVEVINFGVSGYSTAQELVTLRTEVWKYEPDIVLLAFCTANDISDNSRALKKTDIPYFVYRDGRLTLDNSFQEAPGFRVRQSALNRLGRQIRDSLRVIQAMHQAHSAIRTYIASRKARKTGAPSNQGQTAAQGAQPNPATLQGEELGVDSMIYREPTDEVWKDAWRVTEGLLAEMRDEVARHNARLIVVTLSNGIQVFPDEWVRREFMQKVGTNNLFYPDERVRAACEHEGIEVLTLAPLLQSYADERKVFLHGFGQQLGNGHWNAEGHRLAGELTAQKICDGLQK